MRNVFDAGLALGRLLGELAGKAAFYPRALSLSTWLRCQGAAGLAVRREGLRARVASSEVRSESVPVRGYVCAESCRVKNSVNHSLLSVNS